MTSASTWLHAARKRAQRTAAVMALFLLLPTYAYVNQAPICAIDMGSNSFRRIVGLFANGRYTQTHRNVTLGVGDDVARQRADQRGQARRDREGVVRLQGVLRPGRGVAGDGDRHGGIQGCAERRRVVELAASLGIPMEIATRTAGVRAGVPGRLARPRRLRRHRQRQPQHRARDARESGRIATSSSISATASPTKSSSRRRQMPCSRIERSSAAAAAGGVACALHEGETAARRRRVR